MAENLSYGFMELNLCPGTKFDGDDKIWRFIGIQSKNRQEWVITNIANMHNKITTVALYDTLGPDATKFVIDQTELVTIVCSNECIKNLCIMKVEDDTGKTKSFANIVCYDSLVGADDQKACNNAGLKIHTME